MKMYREGTTLAEIIGDGWSRGFAASQTVCEAKGQGFQVSTMAVVQAWVKLDEEMESHFQLKKTAELAVHTWWYSWNHYGVFGLCSEYCTILSAAREGYVPLDAKGLYLKARIAFISPEHYKAEVAKMFKAEKEWADQQCAMLDDDFNEL